MVGAQVSNDPWKSLAARIVLRAIDDYKLVDVFVSSTHTQKREEKKAIRRDAFRWLQGWPCSDEECECYWWCQHLLSHAGINVSPEEVLSHIQK